MDKHEFSATKSQHSTAHTCSSWSATSPFSHLMLRLFSIASFKHCGRIRNLFLYGHRNNTTMDNEINLSWTLFHIIIDVWQEEFHTAIYSIFHSADRTEVITVDDNKSPKNRGRGYFSKNIQISLCISEFSFRIQRGFILMQISVEKTGSIARECSAYVISAFLFLFRIARSQWYNQTEEYGAFSRCQLPNTSSTRCGVV